MVTGRIAKEKKSRAELETAKRLFANCSPVLESNKPQKIFQENLFFSLLFCHRTFESLSKTKMDMCIFSFLWPDLSPPNNLWNMSKKRLESGKIRTPPDSTMLELEKIRIFYDEK